MALWQSQNGPLGKQCRTGPVTHKCKDVGRAIFKGKKHKAYTDNSVIMLFIKDTANVILEIRD